MKNIKGKLPYAFYALLSGLFVVQLISLGALPNTYNIYIIVVVLAFILLFYMSQFKTKNTLIKKLGKFSLILLSIILLFANVYMYRTGSFLNKIGGADTKSDTVSVVVRKDSPYNNLEDVKDLVFYKEIANERLVVSAIEKFEKELNQEIVAKDFKDYSLMATALLDQEIEVMVLNEAFRNFIEDSNEDFSKDTKVIHNYTVDTTIKQPSLGKANSFSVMISGIDAYGSISVNSRSDVNILATVNTKTKEVLLISIPRDYYLPISCLNNELDKLTHSGIYGVDCTMQTVSNAFDVDIDYYARVNFNGLINVVDAVGGVNVYADAPFSIGGYNFTAGENYLDGPKALAFVRDRYNQAGGDRGRGVNQMKVITALIDKMTSPAVITNYTSILNSLEGSFETNMATKDIKSLVRMQVKDMSRWNVEQMQVDGTGATDYSYALGGYYYVMHPDQQTVEAAKAAINEIIK